MLDIHTGYLPKQAGPSILVHGGAWDIPFSETRSHEEGMRFALERGKRLLTQGKPAVQVVAEVVTVLENHPAFDAGVGAVLNQDGEVELDAGIMDGQTLAYGAVAGVKTIQNPIQVAYRLMAQQEAQARFLVAEGAERYAAAQGFFPVKNSHFIIPRELDRYASLRQNTSFHTSQAFSGKQAPRGTVGCVVRDQSGNLAAGTSTGGAPFTIAGRIGDTPLLGAGYYANAQVAASATGWGEGISAVLLCSRIADRIADGLRPDEAIAQRLHEMYHQLRAWNQIEATGGVIAVDANGNAGWAYSTPRMAKGGWQAEKAIWTTL